MSGVDIAGLVEQVQVAAEITGDELLQAASDALLAQAAELAEARPYREELLKIAADVGEPHDPFAAWEVVQALTRQRDEALAALKASEEREDGLREALKLVRGIIVEAAMTGFNCHDGDWAERLFVSQGATHDALVRSLADATNNPPSYPGTEQREAGVGPSPASAPCPHAPTYDAGLCCGHPDDCTFVSPSNLLKEKDDA